MSNCVGSVAEHACPTGSGGAIPTPTLHKSDWHVETAPLQDLQSLVRTYHYARGGANTATFRHGLFFTGVSFLFGAAWWIPPTKGAALATWKGPFTEVLALSRLVLVPSVPKNGATFLLMQSVRLIRRDARFKCLVTYADEWQGHTGGIYRAAGWEYLGLTEPEAVWVDSTGRMTARKAGPHTRTKQEMLDLGCRCLGRFSKHKYRLVL